MKILYPFLLLSYISVGQVSNEKYCKKILVEIDKFTGDTTFSSPHQPGFIDPLFYIKSNGKIMIYLKSFGTTANVGKEGVILLLKNGKKIERPEIPINCEANQQGFLYTAVFLLTEEEINLLSKTYVSAVRLYIYDSDYNEKRQISQMEYLKCLQNH